MRSFDLRQRLAESLTRALISLQAVIISGQQLFDIGLEQPQHLLLLFIDGIDRPELDVKLLQIATRSLMIHNPSVVPDPSRVAPAAVAIGSGAEMTFPRVLCAESCLLPKRFHISNDAPGSFFVDSLTSKRRHVGRRFHEHPIQDRVDHLTFW